MSNPISRRGLLGGLFAAAAGLLAPAAQTPAAPTPAPTPPPPPAPAEQGGYSYDDGTSGRPRYDPGSASHSGVTVTMTCSGDGGCVIQPATGEPGPGPTG